MLLALCYHMREGFEGTEPIDMVLRTVEAGEPDLTELESRLLAGRCALQVLLLRLCLDNVLRK